MRLRLRHMEEDHEGARQRENVLRNASARRQKWLTSGWRVSRNGNPFLNVDGYNIVVYPAGQGWGFRVSNRTTDKNMVSRAGLDGGRQAAGLRRHDLVKERGD